MQHGPLGQRGRGESVCAPGNGGGEGGELDVQAR
jgi:hypothetical protein